MKTLVITPTYGRLPFLGRLVASFLSQTYDDKELVIVNDDPNVQIACNAKGVTCININKKILVGQKRNLATQLGYHDLYLHLDDDDIFLPNRIANNVRIHKELPEINLYRNKMGYMIYGDDFYIEEGAINFVSYKRKGWFEAGGCAHDTNLFEDREFLEKMPNALQEDNLSQIDYVYNYGGINYHLSGATQNGIDGIAMRQLHQLKVMNGKFQIEPDFEEYDKFVTLDKLFKERNTLETNNSVKVIHKGLGKLDIA